MNGLESRDLLRKAEGMEEAYVSAELASRLKEKNLVEQENLNSCLANLVKEEKKALESVSSADRKELDDIRQDKIRHISDDTVKKLVEALINAYPRMSFEVIPYNKQGLAEGVQQKSDLRIKVLPSNEILDISLKQYQKFSNPQVASGTYLSTLAGIAFNCVGRGKYETPSGKTFVSKNHESMKEHFKECYKVDIQPLIDLTKKVHKLRYEEYKPENWSAICKDTGKKAAEVISGILEEMQKNHSTFEAELKERILERTGLKKDDEKHMFFNFHNKKEYKTIDTISNLQLSELISDINHKNCAISFDIHGQGIRFYFIKKSEDGAGDALLDAHMPLTINSNGAWVSKAGRHKKEGIYLKKGQRRPKKSKQLDTSTNFYLNIKKLCSQ